MSSETEKMNNLVISYQKGDPEAVNTLFRKVNPFIEDASRELESLVDNYTEFDCRITLKIKKLLETFDRKRERNFIGIVKTLIDYEKSDFITRRSRKLEEVSKESMEDPVNEEEGIQFGDHSEKVEDEILLKEKIALLAQGDLRKETILTEWTKDTEDSSISKLLAQLFGGKSESHRKFIQRFKSECAKRIQEEGLFA